MGCIKLLIFVLYLSLSNYAGVGGISISKEEDMELDRQLNILNKTPVKTIHTQDGDIFDCIDKYKQPAFDNLLLKNHKIKMGPSSQPQGFRYETSSSSAGQPLSKVLKRFDCPKGTVPIRRTSKEDLKRAKSFSKSFKNSDIRHVITDVPGQHVAIRRSKDSVEHPYFGVHGLISTNNPSVGKDQFSSAQLWIEAGPPNDINTLQAGWAVAPSMFGDNQTRTFVYWHSEHGGCYNFFCSGFVQIDEEYTIGSVLEPSEYKGRQFAVYMTIFQGNPDGDWWLQGGSERRIIGYWTRYIVPNMAPGKGASSIAWGGLVRSAAPGLPSPEMGNGRFAVGGSGNYKKSCSVTGLRFMNLNYDLLNIIEDEIETYVDGTKCYNLIDDGIVWKKQGYSFLFGGPGGDNC